MSIVVEQLTRRFENICAVSEVDFEIRSGEIAGLIGPNGAGKTTLLRILTTFLRPTSGRAWVAGFNCETHELDVRRRLGYLPETLPDTADARVDEYLSFRAQLKDIPAARRRFEIDRCLEACQVRDVRRRVLATLSHGYRRRIGLADALIGDPPVLILDEPTIGFDPLQTRHFRDLLFQLAERHTILLSTHLLGEAETICNRALMMLGGRLVSDLPVEEVRRKSKSLEQHFVQIAASQLREAA
jgi:ABC-2 type transport system ATP-binding protein